MSYSKGPVLSWVFFFGGGGQREVEVLSVTNQCCSDYFFFLVRSFWEAVIWVPHHSMVMICHAEAGSHVSELFLPLLLPPRRDAMHAL